MTEWFPSSEWLETYRARLNENGTYDAASEGWGVDFDGDFVFEISELPVAETTIGELPDDLTASLRSELESIPDDDLSTLVDEAPAELRTRMEEREGPVRDRFVATLLATPVEDAPEVTWPALLEHVPDELEDLLDQLERYVVDGTVHAYLDIFDGDCRETEVLERPPERDTGFVLQGSYGEWVEILEGTDVLDAVFSQEMDLDGSVTTILGYGEAAQAMGDTATRIDTTFLF